VSVDFAAYLLVRARIGERASICLQAIFLVLNTNRLRDEVSTTKVAPDRIRARVRNTGAPVLGRYGVDRRGTSLLRREGLEIHSGQALRDERPGPNQVAGGGFEPPTFGL